MNQEWMLTKNTVISRFRSTYHDAMCSSIDLVLRLKIYSHSLEQNDFLPRPRNINNRLIFLYWHSLLCLHEILAQVAHASRNNLIKRVPATQFLWFLTWKDKYVRGTYSVGVLLSLIQKCAQNRPVRYPCYEWHSVYFGEQRTNQWG